MTNIIKGFQFPQVAPDFSLDKWCVVNTPNADACVLMLAGRGQHQKSLPSLYWHYGLRQYKIVGLQTKALAWYPMPNGAGNQYLAIRGVPHAIKTIEKAVKQIENLWGIPKNKIVLLGYSAGGVMAIQVAIHSDKPYGGAVCQCGAILDTDNVPRSRQDSTPILLTHSQDDEAFEWQERYLPMRRALQKQQYSITTVESPYGGHGINGIDLAMSKLFIHDCVK